MIFYENRLLADDSHVISCLIYFRKLGQIRQNLSSAAVVICVLRVKNITTYHECEGGIEKSVPMVTDCHHIDPNFDL